MPLSSLENESVTKLLYLCGTIYLTAALTGSRPLSYKQFIPWSFEPAGLQPR
jgi:uncharacterized phage-associated protein